MTFETWLIRQTNRDDIIGDLAKDFKDSRKQREKCDQAHLVKHGACEGAFYALSQAKKEYLKSKSCINLCENCGYRPVFCRCK
jgi:hypothetical protein